MILIIVLSIAARLQAVRHSRQPRRKLRRKFKKKKRSQWLRYNLFVFSAFLSQACYRSPFPVGPEVNNPHVYIYQHLDQASPTRLNLASVSKLFPASGALMTRLQTTCRGKKKKKSQNKQKP